MSRIGKNAVQVPDGVTVSIAEGLISVKGKKGEMSHTLADVVEAELNDNSVVVRPRNDSKEARAMWGTTRAVVNNMVTGVSEGFKKVLEIQGVGYRAQVKGKSLSLSLGFSHDVDFPIPEGIEIKTPSPTSIEVTGYDKQKVGQVASEIRSYRPPEPYKGKGVRYEGEYILRKEGKKK